jgi:hypothetical protein
VNRPLASIALLATFSACGLGQGADHPVAASTSSQQEQQKQEQNDKKKDSKTSSSLTGCIDEQNGQYVLVDDQNLNPVANLEADGFPTEGFAKHLGHKVTVRGTSIPASVRPTFKVRSIETVSDTCRSI